MKIFNGIIFTLLLCQKLTTPIIVYAQKGIESTPHSVQKILTNDYKEKIDIGKIEYWFVNNGQGAIDPFNGNHLGLYFPKGTPKSIIYTDGILWAGIVQFPDGAEQLRSGGASYAAGLQAGAILSSGNVSGTNYQPPIADNPQLPKYRIYKIQKDWERLLETHPEKEKFRNDYENWPFDQGAPALKAKNGSDSINSDGKKIPQFLGHQTTFYVANDMSSSRSQNLYGSLPIGIEMQVIQFAYKEKPFEATIFTIRKLINKSGLTVKSMYVSIWSDPDLGNAGDDLVGVDVGLNLGYVYNATNFDSDYNQGTVPAGGYVLFQGPKVAGEVTDTALFDGTKVPGFKNLGLSSFAYYIGGGPTCFADPPLASPNGTIWLYYYQQGLDRCGQPMTNRFGQITKFPYAGPAEDRTSDVDGVRFAPGDRRLMLSSGPFDFAPGDTQEIVSAFVVAQGKDNFDSVVRLRTLANQSHNLYKNKFVYPHAKNISHVKTTSLSRSFLLDWSEEKEVKQVETISEQNYKFEGYRVFQLKNPFINNIEAALLTGDAVLISTFDLNNSIGKIKDEYEDDRFGELIIRTLIEGSNSGIQRFIHIEFDLLKNKPLVNGQEYYYAVTSYLAYQDNRDSILGVYPTYLESEIIPISVIAKPNDMGIVTEARIGTNIPVTPPLTSDAIVQVRVINPLAVTGNSYQIEFYNETHLNSPNLGEVVYNVKNMTTNLYLFEEGKLPFLNLEEGVGNGIYEGLQIIVTGPALTYKDFQIIANANGALNPPSYGAFTFNGWGFPNPGPYQTAGTGSGNGQADRPSTNSQASGKQWGIHRHSGTGPFDDGSIGAGSFLYGTTQYTGGLGRPNQGIRTVIPDDYEIRFTGQTERAKVYNSAAEFTVPFQVWNTKGDADPSNDFRVLPGILDGGADGVYRIYKTDHALSGGDNDPQTDPIYLIEPLDRTPGQKGFNDLLAKIDANPAAWGAELGWAYYSGPDEFDQMNFGTRPSLMRLVFVGYNLISITAPDADWDAAVAATPHPENGTVFKIVTTKPNIAGDKFAFTAPSVIFSPELAKKDVEKINVFPNPYYGSSYNEKSKYEKRITFTGLPPTGKCTIKIYGLSGRLVKEIHHENRTPFNVWNLENEQGKMVASGMYLVHIETEFGVKVLKLGIIQENRLLDRI